MLRSLFFAGAVLLCLSAGAQLMPFKNYGIKDGLSDNNVQAVIRDDRGLLWVGTDFGIYWFDGAHFYRPPLKADVGQLYITGFYKDAEGAIWIQSFFNGLYKYSNGRFSNYMAEPRQKDAAENSIVDMTQLAAHNYLVLTQANLYFFNGRTFSRVDVRGFGIRAGVNSIARLPGQVIALGTEDGIVLFKYSGARLLLLKKILAGVRVGKMVSLKNQLWGTGDKSAFCLAYKKDVFSALKMKTYFPAKQFKDIAAGKENDVWLIGNSGSFWDKSDTVFRIKNSKATAYSRSNGLPENVQQIYFDDEGIAWFANRKGLSMLGDEYYAFYNLVNGRYNDPVTTLAHDDQRNLWAGSITRLEEQKDNRFTFFAKYGHTPVGYIAWMQQAKNGPLLAGAVAGVLKIEKNRVIKYLDIHSTAFSQGPDGSLWFGGINGELWRYDGRLLVRYKTQHPILEMITALHAAADGDIWAGYRDRGIIRYKPSRDSLSIERGYTAVTGFPDLQIRCCGADNSGNVFWGTRTNGVFIFKENGDRPFAHINTLNGLNANWIRHLYADLNSLYLATNNGINIVSGDYRRPAVNFIKINDDNINRETNCITRSGGVFYIGTNEGILKWMPGNITKDTVAPPVFLTRINIQGVPGFSIPPYTINGGQVTLPYNKHTISFEFAGISLKNPENIRYRYVLVGQDNGWSHISRHNDVAFDLKPGSYTFKVAAENADGLWSRRPALFHFVIKPPFWLSWWFIALVVIVTSWIAYSAYRYNLSKALALQLLRNKISTDLHDDIGSTLSSISILSEVAANEKAAGSKRMLAEINERSHLLMEKMDDIVWSISTRNDTVGNLFSRVQQFASTILEAKNIDYEFSIPEKLKTMKLDMQRRQHIYLILKEALNNLIKYSNCTTVCIAAAYTGGLLKLEVMDNGKGFDTSAMSHGNGLLNMESRAAAMHGKFSILSEPGKGTKISLAIQIE